MNEEQEVLEEIEDIEETEDVEEEEVEGSTNEQDSDNLQLTDEQLEAAGVPAGLIRLSCGLEATEDIVADVEQALS